MEDALGLVDRDFLRYNQSVREGRILPRRPPSQKGEVTDLLSQAASGEQLNPDQLQRVIEALQKQKQHQNGRPSPRQLSSFTSPCVCKELMSGLVVVKSSTVSWIG